MRHESLPVPTATIAKAILDAPGWARVGITMPDSNMREKAAAELALTIADHLAPAEEPDPRQLKLFR